jgi:hypothetical protein
MESLESRVGKAFTSIKKLGSNGLGGFVNSDNFSGVESSINGETRSGVF